MFSDPLKLIPLVGFLAGTLGLFTGHLTTDQAMAVFGISGIAHTGISSVNNINPKD